MNILTIPVELLQLICWFYPVALTGKFRLVSKRGLELVNTFIVSLLGNIPPTLKERQAYHKTRPCRVACYVRYFHSIWLVQGYKMIVGYTSRNGGHIGCIFREETRIVPYLVQSYAVGESDMDRFKNHDILCLIWSIQRRESLKRASEQYLNYISTRPLRYFQEETERLSLPIKTCIDKGIKTTEAVSELFERVFTYLCFIHTHITVLLSHDHQEIAQDKLCTDKQRLAVGIVEYERREITMWTISHSRESIPDEHAYFQCCAVEAHFGPNMVELDDDDDVDAVFDPERYTHQPHTMLLTLPDKCFELLSSVYHSLVLASQEIAKMLLPGSLGELLRNVESYPPPCYYTHEEASTSVALDFERIGLNDASAYAQLN